MASMPLLLGRSKYRTISQHRSRRHTIRQVPNRHVPAPLFIMSMTAITFPAARGNWKNLNTVLTSYIHSLTVLITVLLQAEAADVLAPTGFGELLENAACGRGGRHWAGGGSDWEAEEGQEELEKVEELHGRSFLVGVVFAQRRRPDIERKKSEESANIPPGIGFPRRATRPPKERIGHPSRIQFPQTHITFLKSQIFPAPPVQLWRLSAMYPWRSFESPQKA